MQTYIMAPHFMCFWLTLFWLLFYHISLVGADESSRPGSSGIRCIEAERQALLQFKGGLFDPAERLSSWAGPDCCSWSGILCSNLTDHVIHLDLRNPNPEYKWDPFQSKDTMISELSIKCFDKLRGKLHPSLLDLKHLHYLDLSCNDFQGVGIPEFIGLFKELRYLNLSTAAFSGTIPPHLGNLSYLQSLDLSFNYHDKENNFNWLFLDDGQWLSGLTSLQHLNLNHVDLSRASNLFQGLNMLPSLLEIHLSYCQILPSSLSLPYVNFSSLSTLDLSNNHIRPSIPCWLFNITSLEYLYLDSNDFQGQIPASIGILTSLKVLDLSHSIQSVIQLPTTLGNLCNLHKLGLSFINLSLQYSDQVGRILSGCLKYSLMELDMSNTFLTDNGADWLGFLSNLKVLDLSNNGIKSTLAHWLLKLNKLEYLYLGGNDFSGRSLASIGGLTSLKILDLSYNPRLELPTTFGNLCKLQTLSLRGSGLSLQSRKLRHIFTRCITNSLINLDFSNTSSLQGQMPDWIGTLKNLKVLNVSYNNINSTLPLWLFNMTGISYLDLSHNDFQGTILLVIENMISLETLLLNSNSHMQTQVPMTMGNLCKLKVLGLEEVNIRQNFTEYGAIFAGCIRNSLQELYLNGNSLTGHLPEEIGNLRKLKYLYLHSNSISGVLPKSLGQLLNLVRLDLGHNKLESVLSEGFFSNLTKLQLLDLSHNAIKGVIAQIPPKAKVFDLSNNSLSGPITMKINGTFPYLVSLILSMNGITGTIPPALCNFTNAKVLDLSKNNLSGEMPSCWSEDSKLKVLDFSNNNISGEIHDSICSLHRLESLHLSHNSLSTTFPASLRKCKGLVTLDLSHNKFYGRIPDWLGESMPNLKILNLRSNSFTGYLPSQLSVLSRLHILDISNNNLSGSIPKSFGSFISMRLANDMRRSRNDYYDGYYEENVVLVVKGNEFSFDNILYLVNAIDLSNNSLCGSIPEELADLSALQSLNLSINHLNGEITSKIGKLQELESLDLSKNNISGAIPSSLDSLDFLGRLNLSFNNLSGKIPSGKHLDTFVDDPSIYIGNYGLCGPPLTKYCPGEEEPEAPAGDGQENDEDAGLSDDALFYLSIGTGFLVGLWTVFITILCKKRWRVAYFRCLDDMYDRVCVAVIINFTRLKRRCSKK